MGDHTKAQELITRLDAYAVQLRQLADEADELSHSLFNIQQELFLIDEGGETNECIRKSAAVAR